MSDKGELKQRKSKDQSKIDSKESKTEVTSKSNSNKSSKESNKNESKSTAAPVINASDLKKITEEHHQNIGKKMFRRSLKRVGLICLAFTLVYLYQWLKTDPLFEEWVTSKHEIHNVPLVKQVACSDDDYTMDRKMFPKCAPTICGRLVIDDLINEHESHILLSLFKKALLLNPLSANQSASILDLHSGALTYGNKFINVYALLKTQNRESFFSQTEFNVYKQVKEKIRNYIAKQFQISATDLYLTSPTFFSKLTDQPAQNIHDEYWHQHIDKQTYKSFHYTSLLYLNTYYQQFSGGRFVFVDKNANRTVEPKQSRVSIFTSGAENPHLVERVEKGVRYAITISFTCDPQLAIDDPKLLN